MRGFRVKSFRWLKTFSINDNIVNFAGMNQQFFGYGPEVSPEKLAQLLDELLDFSDTPSEGGLWQLPFCIWGKAGIGKTALIHDYAREKGLQLVHLAPAQIEEMGDLLGMPAISGEQTVFRQPSWVPQSKGPGILLLDDFNRADERIIKGLMQLLQEKKIIAWSLPPAWVIVLTANPETLSYNVTPLDKAVMTRMMHFTMVFDAQGWVHWAEKHHLANWCIDFALAHQELFEEERHTPRTFSQFAFQVSRRDLAPTADNDALFLLARSILGEKTALTLKQFLSGGFQYIPSIPDMLTADDFEGQIARLLGSWNEKAVQRVDLFSILINRLNAYLSRQSEPLTADEVNNLKKFLLLPSLPSDQRFQLAQDWSNSPSEQLQQLIREPEVARVIL
jgi:hypothetical protein